MDVQTAKAAVDLLVKVFNQVKEFSPAYRQFKIRSEYDDNVFREQYIKSMSENVHNISEENFQDPNHSIIYPAVNESLFYVREEEIREMFAKLISSSFDKSKNEFLHPGFIGIIKQLSPFDARLLISIHDSSTIKGFVAISNNVEYKLIETNLLEGPESVNQISLSLDNLIRLGLINIDKNLEYTVYDKNGQMISLHSSSELAKTSKFYSLLHEQYKLYTANAYITVLGQNFLKVCVD